MRAWVDSMAERLAALASVSVSQWALRLAAAAATVGAGSVVTTGAGTPEAGAAALLVVLSLTAWQTARPDGHAGTAALGILALWAILGSDGRWLPSLGAGMLLLIAHACWAIAAMGPAHMRVDRRAWWPLARPHLLVAVAAAGVGVLVVVPLAGMDLGVVGALGAIAALVALALVLLPRRR